MTPRRTLLLAATAAALLASGCAKRAPEVHRDVTALANAYYRAHPDFFHFKTLADLPKGLVWEDGHDAPAFGWSAEKPGGMIRTYLPSFPRTLRFVGPDAADAFRQDILDEVAPHLIAVQPNTLQYFPGVAKQWAFDPDGRTMYFRIDPDARYSDGVPVTTGDYFFLFYFMRSPWLQDPWYNDYYRDYYTQITRYDDRTFSLTWYVRKPDLAFRLGQTDPIPEHFYRDFGPDYLSRYNWTIEPTTGPYTVRPEDVHKGEYIDITYVPHWWAADKPYFRNRYPDVRIRFIVVRDPNKAIELFKRGDLDIIDLTEPPTSWYVKLPDADPLVQRGAVAKVQFYNQIPRPTYGFDLNCADPLLANRDIREGIAYAADFDLVDRLVFRGDWVRMQTSADGYPRVPFPGIHPRPFSIDQALKCFAKAGFVSRGPDGILVNAQGQRLSFLITCPYERMHDALVVLREQAAKAGLDLRFEIPDELTAYKKIEEKHHQIAFAAVEPSVEPYPRYWEFFDSSQANRPTTNNWTDTVDPVMDRLIDQYDRAVTWADIRRLATQLELRIRYDAAFIPGFEAPYYRCAFWRYLKFPPEFSTRSTLDTPFWNGGYNYGLFWVDDSARPAVEAAAHGGAPLPPEIKVYTQWKTR